jgi:phage tail-like protein
VNILDLDIGAGVYFLASLDNEPLGSFNSCEGLGCEIVVEQREEGGNNGYVWQLPTRIKYSNIKLTRPVTVASIALHDWFSSIHSGMKRHTAVIEAHGPGGIPIGVWGLLDVMPVRWTGPSLSPDQNKVATETLELAHHGFFTPKVPR